MDGTESICTTRSDRNLQGRSFEKKKKLYFEALSTVWIILNTTVFRFVRLTMNKILINAPKLTLKERMADATSRKSEEMAQEMEREHVVSPANLGELKTELESIGRCDLASTVKGKL